VCRHIDDAKSLKRLPLKKNGKKSSSQYFANENNTEPLMLDPHGFLLVSVSTRPCLGNLGSGCLGTL